MKPGGGLQFPYTWESSKGVSSMSAPTWGGILQGGWHPPQLALLPC